MQQLRLGFCAFVCCALTFGFPGLADELPTEALLQRGGDPICRFMPPVVTVQKVKATSAYESRWLAICRSGNWPISATDTYDAEGEPEPAKARTPTRWLPIFITFYSEATKFTQPPPPCRT
ncbi:MAG: hypothetical protein R3C53_24440 [Pirellulaceae bacterium]